MNEPDFKNYTLEELTDSLYNIDRNNYPERVKIIELEIQKKKKLNKEIKSNDTHENNANQYNDYSSTTKVKNKFGYFESYSITDINSALKAIKQGWLTGLIFGSYLFLMTVLATNDIKFIFNQNYSYYSFIDAFLVLFLTFGIYKKIQICALLLVAYIVFVQIYIWIQSSDNSISMMYIPVVYFIYKSFLGLLKYNTLTSENE